MCGYLYKNEALGLGLFSSCGLRDVHKMSCDQRTHLPADLRNSGAFPQHSFAKRTENKKIIADITVRVTYRSISNAIDTKAERIGNDVALSQEIAQKRLVQATYVALRACAIDDSVHMQRVGFLGTAQAVRYSESRTVHLHAQDTTRNDREAARSDQCGDLFMRGARHAMAMDLPERAHMTKEATAFGMIQPLPQGLCIRAHSVHDGLPWNARIVRAA